MVILPSEGYPKY